MSSPVHKEHTPPFRPDGHATLIGSIPLADHDEALDLIFRYTPSIPLWPQLPGRREEGMLLQFNEGLPLLDDTGNKIHFATEAERLENEQLAFFEEYLTVSDNMALLPDSRFRISPDHARGLYRLVERAQKKPDILAVKGQITGPFTLLTGVSDAENRAGYYNAAIREMITKGLAMKAAWQVTFLQRTGKPVIVFIDEPALAGLGSNTFISVADSDIIADQSEMIAAIHCAGGLAGVHVCANTNWPLLLGLDYDILNFDAYGFFDKLAACREELDAFLERGGIIAWGIVPTSNEKEILTETPDTLIARWEEQAGRLTTPERDISTLLRQSLITPSCGTGALTALLASRVLELTAAVSAGLRKKYL
ncbi:MAG: hypothetical protein ACOY4H_05790 [Thermodesulfobacteriota bacterium]